TPRPQARDSAGDNGCEKPSTPRKGPAVDHDSGMYQWEFPLLDLTAPDGNGPLLIHGLEGFTDAGHAVRLTTEHLLETLESEPVAVFTVDQLLDYRSRRPTMTFRDNAFVDYNAPRLELRRMLDDEAA